MLSKSLLALALLSALQGCANYGNEVHMEGASFSQQAQPAASDPVRLKVVIIRERPLISRVSYMPWDALPIALNGKMVALLPVGSSVVLSLEPGAHQVLWARKFGGRLQGKAEIIPVDGVGGTVRYIFLEHGVMDMAASTVSEDVGRKLMASTSTAKLLHNGASFETFKQRIEAANRNTLAESIQAAMPTGKQVTSALETIGSIALVGLEIAAVVAGGVAEAQSGPPSLVVPAVQPTPTRAMQARRAPAEERFRYGASGVGDVLRSGSETRLRDYRTGTTYSIQDGAVRGSDGSRFRVVGTTLYSDSGAAYQIVGNTLRSPDGRTCRRVIDTIHCD